MGDTFEKRKREQNKRRKKQDKALRKQERALDEGGSDVVSLEDIVGDIAHPDAREMSAAARQRKEEEGGQPGSAPTQSAAARRAAEAGKAVRGRK